MDLFSEIDRQKLKRIIDEIDEKFYNFNSNNDQDKIYLIEKIYQIESEFAIIKNKLELPILNSSIVSNSVVKSFRETPITKSVFGNREFSSSDFLRQNDYQYWLLIFLLIKNNEIRNKNLTLFEIIDQFIEKVKDKSFTWRDIEITGSGVTRCKTNLRFTYDDLKRIGLVNLYDNKYKKSWTLTFLGFFLAVSFCYKPADKYRQPFTNHITKFMQSTYYYKINTLIWERINQLSEPKYFNDLVKKLSIENLGLPELKSGPEIFSQYYNFIKSIETDITDKAKRKKVLARFLDELNQKYSLDEYMNSLSYKFDMESFQKGIKKVYN